MSWGIVLTMQGLTQDGAFFGTISSGRKMMHPRNSEEVVQELLDAMQTLVTKYHPEIRQTGSTLAGLIHGTAFFPGGSGLWRGLENGGPLPTQFPDEPVMFVGHNFDSCRAFKKAFAAGGEAGSQFWKNLLAILKGDLASSGKMFLHKRHDGAETWHCHWSDAKCPRGTGNNANSFSGSRSKL